jgi:hypothetical protein
MDRKSIRRDRHEGPSLHVSVLGQYGGVCCGASGSFVFCPVVLFMPLMFSTWEEGIEEEGRAEA